MKRAVPFLISLLLIPLAALHAADAPAKKPNIIFIMADDLGYTDVACFGSKYYEVISNRDALNQVSEM